MLDSTEWGFVVENFKEFYGANDYVKQMESLVQYIKDNPEASYAYFLAWISLQIPWIRQSRSPTNWRAPSSWKAETGWQRNCW